MMFLGILFLLAIAGLSITFTAPRRPKNKPFRPPPGPRGLPVLGNLHQFNFSSPYIYFAKLAKIYGPILSLRLGSTPIVVVQSAKMAKEVLKTQDLNFCNRPPTAGSLKLSYNAVDIIFGQYNKCFREMKKISIVHLLSTKRVQSFAPILQDEIHRLLNQITSLSSASKAVNLSELLMAFATANICRIAFGKRHEDQSPRSRFHSLLNEVQALFIAFFFSDYFPYLGWLDMLRGQSSRLERTFKESDEFYEELIIDHLDPNRPKSNQEDLIDVLIQLRKERSFTFDLSHDHIKSLLMDMFVAGSDTSTAMVVWAMTELIKNPTTMNKVQAELRNTTGNKGYGVWEDLQNVEYFKAVVKETFRMHPAGPLLVAHETVRECKLEGYDILPKSVVYLNVWAIGRDPDTWKDPEVFMPERFLGSSIDFKGQDFELLPFGAGRRICPGLHMGVSTVELTLANLLYWFDWELPVGMKGDDIDTDTMPGLTMHKKNPLCLIARKFRELS